VREGEGDGGEREGVRNKQKMKFSSERSDDFKQRQ
jgi:hypothetical protein